jgi:hypothetical protein
LVLGIVALSGGFGGAAPKAAAAPPSAAPSPTAPPFQTTSYTDARKFTLNVPAGWTKAASSSFVDFTDPQDSGRRMRVNVEAAGGTNTDFMAAVARTQQNDSTRCAVPFNKIAIRDDVTLAGRSAAELEYTCGSGGDMRHIIWRATVVNKQAYEFYLSVPDSEFDASKVIYDEAVRSYTLNLG